jgi:hypothetical protein
VYLASAGVSRRSVEHVPGKGSYQDSTIMIPSCREVICSKNRTVSPLPVAQRIRREVTQSVETQTEHKLPGRHQHKPRDLATSKTNSDHWWYLQQVWRAKQGFGKCQKQLTRSLTLSHLVGARNPRANTGISKVPT